MNTGYLHEVASDLKQELQKTQQTQLLEQLAAQLHAQITYPQQPQHKSHIESTRSQLTAALQRAPSNSKTPTWHHAVSSLGFSDLIGNVLADRIEHLFARGFGTPSQLQGEIAQIAEAVKTRQDHLQRLLGAMAGLGLGDSELSGASAIFTIIVPRGEIRSDALELSRDLRHAQDLVRTATEYLTGQRTSVVVVQIASSDFQFDFEVIPKVAAFLAKAIDRILSWYKTIHELRKSRAALAEKAVPKEMLQSLDDHIDDRTKGGVKEAVRELLDGFEAAVDTGRRNELNVELELRLNWTAKRIDRGYKFDVRVLPKAAEAADNDTTASAQKQYIEDVIEFSGKLRFERPTGELMLQLPEAKAETE
jgi:hypothetical protein